MRAALMNKTLFMMKDLEKKHSLGFSPPLKCKNWLNDETMHAKLPSRHVLIFPLQWFNRLKC